MDPANVNTHPPEQLEVLKSILHEFGQRLPLVTRASTGILPRRGPPGRGPGARLAAVQQHADLLAGPADALQVDALLVQRQELLGQPVLVDHRQGGAAVVTEGEAGRGEGVLRSAARSSDLPT